MIQTKVFLDKDDLKTGAGAEYVDVSNVVLCFCTEKYFQSRACAREIFRAVLRGKPLIAMLEPDASRGGLTRAAIEALLTTARYPPHDQTWAAKWALDGEVQAWGYAAIPTCEQIVAALFALPPIEWNRFTAFLQVTMRLTAERLLSEADRGSAVYVQGEVGNQTLMPPDLTQRRTHHLYCSPHNLGADRLGAELNELFRRRSGKDRRGRRSVADAAPLKVATSFAELEQCEHMLVCESHRDDIVGTTRILVRDEPELGKPDSFYSQTEFVLDNVLSLPGRKMEIGRTCIAAEYRSGGGIMTLWSGLCEFMFERDVDQLLGCASISVDDPQYDTDEILGYLQSNHLSDHDKRVYPKTPWASLQGSVAGRPPAMPP